jgi:hypothetical protein
MLPSQFARPKGARSHMYRRTRSKRWSLLIALVAIVGCAAVLFKWWPGGEGVAPAGASTAVPETDVSLTSNNSGPASASKGTDLKANKPTSPALIVPPPAAVVDQSKKGEASASAPLQAKLEPTSPKAIEKTEQIPLAKVETKPAPPPVTSNALMPQAKTPAALSNSSSAPPKSETAPSANRAAQRIQAGMELIAQNKPLEARRMLSLALESQGISPADAEKVRNELSKVNQRLVFGPEVVPGDPFCKSYVIEGGDALSKLPKKLNLHTEYLFLKRINAIENERRLRVGQRIKTVTGPFHAVVDKRAFRMDLYLGDGDQRVFVQSLRVGLGEFDATPEGVFDVKRDSKLINPAWANPRTGEQFAPDDPKNPLGEYWIGLVGASDNIRGLEGYGVHGTIEPESIGQMKSMGCVRMLHDDVALVYELLMPGVSTVTIRGQDYQ